MQHKMIGTNEKYDESRLLLAIFGEKPLTPKEKAEKERKEREREEKRVHGTLPYWVIFPAWLLCFFASTGSALFTLFYSMMWGKEKSNAWLTTIVFSFTQDTFLSQPIKIVVVASLFAIIVKRKPQSKENKTG